MAAISEPNAGVTRTKVTDLCRQLPRCQQEIGTHVLGHDRCGAVYAAGDGAVAVVFVYGYPLASETDLAPKDVLVYKYGNVRREEIIDCVNLITEALVVATTGTVVRHASGGVH